MGSDEHHHHQREQQACINLEADSNKKNHLHEFRLFETYSNYYIIGCDMRKTFWKVLKINRLEPSELNITEDNATYSKVEHRDLLQRIDVGNKSTGGLKLVRVFYGICGFVKFLGPYYMVLITERRQIGMIGGHAIYAIAKSEMVQIPNSTFEFNKAYSKNENRYKKLLCAVDLTKDFFFSYSYHVMLSLQKNQSNHELGIGLYETMFVWNEFLTRGIRNQLKNTVWTVALVHGFFKQVKLSVSGGDFLFTLIARRSRHYAGPRYLKRGVNEKGRVANDVETEQIVLEDVNQACPACPIQMSSVVQIRGSIPLFWSQETSLLNLKPDIILSDKDPNYEATKLHFENLVKRYGNPVIILNLIKTRENKPRESILRAEFANAIAYLNRDLAEEDHLKFLHWDLNNYSKDARTTLLCLVDVAAYALRLTGFFYCQIIPTSGNGESPYCTYSSSSAGDCAAKDNLDMRSGDDKFLAEVNDKSNNTGVNYCFKSPWLQKGVLRTNCIDCLDRTNVAQYAYGLVALGCQLQALGLINIPIIDTYSSLAGDLMKIYEEMGDTLALQYTGSRAHKKIFSGVKGHWKAATQSQGLIRNFKRHCSNTYADGEKQDAINVFLGHFQPQLGKPSLWELDSDQHYNLGRHGSDPVNENSRLRIKRTLSDGNILRERKSCMEDANVEQNQHSNLPLPDKIHCHKNGLLSSEMSACESDISYSRYAPSMSSQKPSQIQPDIESDGICFHERGEPFNCSNFLDVEWLSSSGNSCEENTYERSTLIGTSCADLVSYANDFRRERSSSYGSVSSIKGKDQTTVEVNLGDSSTPSEFSETFIKWVTHGNMLII